MSDPVVDLREYVEAIFREKQQAMVVAEQEREKTRMVAEQEREKAAQARRMELDHRIQEVDVHLRQHITSQIDQVNSDRNASVKLLETMIQGVKNEMTLIHEASEKAVAKAEEQNTAWRAQANEWRGQSSDREKSQEAQMTALSATFLPRESHDKVIEGWSNWRDDVNNRLNTLAAIRTEERRTQDRLQPWQLWAAGVLITLVVVLANYIAAT